MASHRPAYNITTSTGDVRPGLGPLTRFCLAMIAAYQALLRPFLIGSCKFYPTCSDYAAEAIGAHGVWRGSRLAARRVCRCHPFGMGGYDPVPPPHQDAPLK